MVNEEKIATVLIAKSDKMLNELICEFVKEKGLSIIGSVDNGTDALRLLVEKSPHILITGAELPGLSGIDLAAWLLKNNYATQTILFSRIKSQVLVEVAKQFNVIGYLFFDDGIKELSSCIDSVLAGRPYVSPQVQEMLDNSSVIKNKPVLEAMKNGVTSTELRVLWYMSEHLSTKQIASNLFISPNTVNNHLANIRKKLNLNGRGVLLRYALGMKDKLLSLRL